MKTFFLPSLLLCLAFLCTQCQSNTDEKPAEQSKEMTPNVTPEAALNLFVGTYTRKEGHVDGKAEGIYWYEMDRSTGILSHVHTFDGPINPSYLTLHPNGKYLYAVNEHNGTDEFPKGTVTAFSIDRKAKKLTELNKVSAEGGAPCFISVPPSGSHALVANYIDGNVIALPIQADGSLQAASSNVIHLGKGQHPRQETPHAHQILMGPDEHVYAADLGIDQVLIYDFTDGQLQQKATINTSPGAGPRHITFHPQMPVVYVLNELNGTIEMFNKNAQGIFNNRQTIATTPDNAENSAAGCADIHLTPDGQFLYASNRGEVNSISIFKVDAKSGELAFQGMQSEGVDAPRNFVIDPSGTFLLVANQNESTVTTFKINSENGSLDKKGQTAIKTPVCLQFSE